MIRLRLAVPAVLVAAAFAGCLTYFVVPLMQVDTDQRLPATIPTLTARTEPLASDIGQHLAAEQQAAAAFERAAKTIPEAVAGCDGICRRRRATNHRAYPVAKEAPNPAVTQDRCCVLAFGPDLDRKASNAWAMRIPTLRTMKNAAITSNIDGPCAIEALTKRSTFCTVKEIPLSGRTSRRMMI
jgi:hypothetical protein